MKQETLEEAAKEFFRKFKHTHIPDNYHLALVEFSKLQQERSYSEEEVKRLAFKFYLEMSKQMKVPDNLITENYTNVDEWFDKLNPIKNK